VASTFSHRNAEIDRFLWHAREPFDDGQLTALSNLCEPRPPTPSTAMPCSLPLKAAGDLPTQGRARAGSVSSRLSTVFRRTAPKLATPTPSSPAAVATAAGGSPSFPRLGAVVDNLRSHGRSRLASMPVRAQFNVTKLAAAGKQADLETERLQGARSQERCRVCAREDAAAATAATQAVSSEQLNSLTLRFAVGTRARDFVGA
jgi:hypothetical protein